MATQAELARAQTRLEGPQVGHLQRLLGSWGMLADLCFADLLLFVPVTTGEGSDTSRFIVVGQMRPTTSQTLHREFPFISDEAEGEDSPRVGDGALLLDETGRVEYASPNAVNALHRMGIYSNAEGLLLGDLGIDEAVVRLAMATRIPATEEVERGPDVIVLVRCIPLLYSGRVTGALVLMRDVTDLRRRDRLLLSKD